MLWMRILATGISFLSVIGGIAYIRHSIYQDGFKACQNAQTERFTKAVIERVKYDHTTAIMDSNQLDSLGSSRGWVRSNSDR